MKIAIKRVQRQAVLGYAERAQFGAKLKTFRLFSMAALALAMAACSNEDSALENAAPAQQQGAMKFTATLAAPGSGATTRTVYTEVTEGDDAGKINVAWKAGDEIYLLDDESGATTATVGTPAADGSAAISGTITGSDGDNVSAYYPASAITDFDAFFAKYNAQEGTLDYIQNNLDLRMGEGTLSVNGGVATLADNLEMQSMIVIWKLTLQNSSSQPLAATKVTVYLDGGDIASTTDISGTSTVYLALPLLGDGDGSFSDIPLIIMATVGDDTYKYEKESVSIARGKYYQSTVKMAKVLTYPVALSAVTADYIGSVVCSDGNVYPAKTAAPSGKTAIGILGKVTATGHGLILALEDAEGQEWTTINSWTSVTTYASTTLKVLPDDDARGDNLTSYTTLGATAVSDWAVAQKSDYEAIFTNLGSTTGNSDGKTYDGNVNAYITTGVGGTAISGANWSATVLSGSNNAWYFGSNSSKWNNDQKTSSHSVRPVLGF